MPGHNTSDASGTASPNPSGGTNLESSTVHVVSLPYPASSRFPLVLPLELHTLLNDTYSLYLLSTDPSQIIPPGKSLISAFALSNDKTSGGRDGEDHRLEDQVTEMVRKAFWEEALESFSSSDPSTVVARVQRFYQDLNSSLVPLFPFLHPIMSIFSSPLSPTPSPLRTVMYHLRELLVALKQRCAPARDPEIDLLLSQFSYELNNSVDPKSVVEVLKGTLELIDRLKSDLRNFVFSNLTESDLKKFVRREGKSRERELVLKLYGGIDRVQEAWKEWVSYGANIWTDPPAEHWKKRLVVSITSPQPISIPIPLSPFMPPSPPPEPQSQPQSTPTPNHLPPSLLLPSPTLFHVQNLFQALLSTAALRLLVSPTTTAFTQRIWTLLELEVERGGTVEAETKLVNLEDEVVREGMKNGKRKEEDVLRREVRAILRTEDPVFKLLSKRVGTFLENAIVLRPGSTSPAPTINVPLKLRTGFDRHHVQNDATSEVENSKEVINVQGFDGDEVLQDGLRKILKELRGVVEWAEWVWGDVIS